MFDFVAITSIVFVKPILVIVAHHRGHHHTITLIALLVTMAFALIRAIKGPTVYDRILASNALGTKTVLMITVLGFMVGDPELYIDIALMYVLIGFIGTVAVLKVSEFGNLGQPQSHTDPEDP